MLLLLALACAPTSKDTAAPPTDTGRPDSADTSETDTQDSVPRWHDTDTSEPYCADVPTVTYESFGRGFLTGNCQACHASTTANRYGAPEDVTFDTVEEVWARAEQILDVATWYDEDEPSMPPQGGVTTDDQTRLEWWLRCATPGT